MVPDSRIVPASYTDIDTLAIFFAIVLPTILVSARVHEGRQELFACTYIWRIFFIN